MILKIITFGIALLGMVFIIREFLIDEQIPISIILFHTILFAIYLFLLNIQLRSGVQKRDSPRKLRRLGFYFTFWIGCLWSAFISFSSGLGSWFDDPIHLIGLIISISIGGGIFGLLGMAITQFLLIYLYRLSEEQ